MYRPLHFVEDRPEVLEAAIRRWPLASLISAAPDGLIASYLPLVPSRDGEALVLNGHFARANPHWQAIAAGAETLVLFQGEQAYVSPGWYETKKETGKAVPTWNYITIEARGLCEVFVDGPALRAHVAELSAIHEAPMAEPWSIEDAPARFIEQMLAAIVSFRMRVASLQGKWKLSQNRPEVDRRGVIEGLKQQPGGEAMAREVAEAMTR